MQQRSVAGACMHSAPNAILVCAPTGDPGLMVSPSRDADYNYSPNREKQSHNYVVSFRIILHCHRSCATATATPGQSSYLKGCKMMT
ncbi:hypothetical protein CEXT_581321 [Caerostris extrusa]|uniref:Uncharacterized protein n=1 Tax=Caerostris extrusa TaxID=172846 RepID=A0AAV4VQS5_CAEEX|nr:hypothetical protein CEXT_581321 [Caerostris extrusa]